jgi:hypothetical protein
MHVEARRRSISDIVKHANEIWKSIVKLPSQQMNELVANKHHS